MNLFSYELIIFDCDGVILDSNRLKIDAMKKSLELISDNHTVIAQAVDYFRKNFGRSRFHHVEVFEKKYFSGSEIPNDFSEQVLEHYSRLCKVGYLKANITPGFLPLLDGLEECKLFVASGSEQSELRSVFQERGLAKYFKEVYGSPTAKSENVRNILMKESPSSAVMLGDAVSDYEAASSNNIDFIGYLPFSNVKDRMVELSSQHGFPVINDYSELL